MCAHVCVCVRACVCVYNKLVIDREVGHHMVQRMESWGGTMCIMSP